MNPQCHASQEKLRVVRMRLKGEELLAFGQFNQLDKAIPEDQLEALLR